MTNTVKPNSLQKLPENEAEVTKMLRPRVMKFVLLIVVVLTLMAGGVPFLTLKLHFGPKNPASIAIDFLSGILIMAIFFNGSNRLAASLLEYGRNFVNRGQWADAEDVLGQFNQWGLHFLDPTGEAHFLLATALGKRGKRESAGKARDFVLKYRTDSEWAQQLGGTKQSQQSKKTIAQETVDKAIKPSRPKRRRY